MDCEAGADLVDWGCREVGAGTLGAVAVAKAVSGLGELVLTGERLESFGLVLSGDLVVAARWYRVSCFVGDKATPNLASLIAYTHAHCYTQAQRL